MKFSKQPVPSFKQKNKGFTLIEALVAFLILSIGSLAFTKVQMVLRHNSDVAKQRSEAVRLAEEKIENLRAFSFINEESKNYFDAATLSKIGNVVVFDALTDSSEQITNSVYNTTYTRTVKITDQTTYKVAFVKVNWTDRYGDTQSVQMTTAIARTAPSMLGQVMLTPVPPLVKNPFNRNLKIPVSAVDLGNGKSGFIPPGNNTQYYVFSNTDASVFQVCNLSAPTTTLTLAEYQNYGSTKCQNAPGYFISGSISFDITTKIDLLDNGGKRPADPPTSVCQYYNDAGSLITGSVAIAPTTGGSTLLAAAGATTYYALNVTLGTPSPTTGSTCVPVASTFKMNVSTDKASNSAQLTDLKVNSYTAKATIGSTTSDVTGTWSASIIDSKVGNAVITFTPSGGKFPSGATINITIPVGGLVFSNSGNKFSPDSNTTAISTQFDTQGIAPQLVTTSPANGATLTDMNQNIDLTFNEAVVANSGVITLNRFTNANKTTSKPVETFSLPSSTRVTIASNKVTIDPVAPLDTGDFYFLTIDNTALKSTGSCSVNFEGITSSSTFSFSTSGGTTTTCPTNPLDFIGLTIPDLSSSPAGATVQCYSDSKIVVKDNANHYINYFCVVLKSGADSSTLEWDGTLKLQGPPNWLTSSKYRVCRYTNPDGDAVITSNEHPAKYTKVSESLSDQNFLVIKNSETCPKQILNVTKDLAIYFTTETHQP